MAAVKMASASTYNPPCAACKFLKRKCLPDCIFAPYFPPEEPQKFINVHKIFGASNVSKILNDVLPHQRGDAVSSLAFEAEARVRDPVYGCVGAISFLLSEVERLERQLEAANANWIRYVCNENSGHSISGLVGLSRRMGGDGGGGGGGGRGGGFHPDNFFPFPRGLPWSDNHCGDITEGRRDD
ncbi:hypothetical protein NMG60_11002957 [Bertholletia excelsa]